MSHPCWQKGQSLSRHQKNAARATSSAREHWAERKSTFEWLSRYRTLYGFWSGGLDQQSSLKVLDSAGRQLFEELGLDGEGVKLQIRDSLLNLFRQWEQLGESVPSRARSVLQEDIALSLLFLEAGTGKPTDFNDPVWQVPADRQPRGYTPLLHALPYETHTARDRFPRYAMRYLGGDFTPLTAKLGFEEEHLRQQVALWWDGSPAFRRFAVAFHRLHEHAGTALNEDNLVGLRKKTPIDLLNTAALHVERLVGERLAAVSAPKDDFHAMVKEMAKQVARHYGLREPELAQLRKHANLRNLPSEKNNRFVRPEEFENVHAEIRPLAKLFTNFAIMRNYAAHHDCIDREMETLGWARAGVEAITAVAIMSLEAVPPGQSC